MCGDFYCTRYLLGYVRLLQLFKIRSAFSTLNLMEESVANSTSTLVTSLATLLLNFVVLSHWFTCIWFLVQVYPINFQVNRDLSPGEVPQTLDLADSWLWYV